MLEKLDVPFQLQSMHSSCKLQKKKIPSSFRQKSTSECVDLLRWDEKPREELSAMSHPCAFQRRSIYCQLVYFLQRHFSVLPAEFSFGLLLTYSFKSPIEIRDIQPAERLQLILVIMQTGILFLAKRRRK